METKKNSKLKGKAGKTPEKKAASVKAEVNSVRIEPTEEEIREKANEIYNQRIERGEHGTDISDWIEAEVYLRDSIC
jgi:hypothetical protein